MTSTRFVGRTAAVTGAASGIGLAAAQAFVREGGRAVLLDRDGPRAQAAAEQLGPSAMALALDVSDGDAVTRAFDDIGARYGSLDVLVNNAGVGTPATLERLTPDMWRRTLGVNLDGAYHCLRAALPLLKAAQGGAIVNVASVAGKRLSHHGGADYTASKSALLGLTRHAAFELARHRIRVNAVCPGIVLTPMVEAVTTPEQREASVAKIPLGRWVMPEDIAAAILFLASPDAAMITGTTVDVDGGLMVSNGQPYSEYLARRGEH